MAVAAYVADNVLRPHTNKHPPVISKHPNTTPTVTIQDFYPAVQQPTETEGK